MPGLNGDRRLIEDYLPIEAISAEATREKSVRKGHVATLHLWWARRPLVACRAAVYGALVPASRYIPEGGTEDERAAGRELAAAFVGNLCKYPGNPATIAQAEQHILEAHAERLSQQMGARVTVVDIVSGLAPRPKVLDMFAGGGSIPLEALRLGCEAYALDLNPVAHIIELCTLVYPQMFGKPDSNARGMTGPKNEGGESTWGGLAEEVRYWGELVLARAKNDIGDLYPPIPDPSAGTVRHAPGSAQLGFNAPDFQREDQQEIVVDDPQATLTPVAYLWTRTVRCRNPNCGADVPLVRQTWLCKKRGRFAALKISTQLHRKQAIFQVVEADTAEGLGFDPEGFSKGGSAICPFCGTVADVAYVRSEAVARRLGRQMMAAVCARSGGLGRVYVSADDQPLLMTDDVRINERLVSLCATAGLTLPDEVIEANPRSMDTQHFGLMRWSDLFTPRQLLCLLNLISLVHTAEAEAILSGYNQEQSKVLVTYLALVVDRLADWNSTLCSWSPEGTGGAKIGHTFSRQALPMVWDFAESAVLGEATGSAALCLKWVLQGVEQTLVSSGAITVIRGSATSLPWASGLFDAVITDPPPTMTTCPIPTCQIFTMFG